MPALAETVRPRVPVATDIIDPGLRSVGDVTKHQTLAPLTGMPIRGPVAVVPGRAVLPAEDLVVPAVSAAPLRPQIGVGSVGGVVRPQEAGHETVLVGGVNTTECASQGGTLGPVEDSCQATIGASVPR